MKKNFVRTLGVVVILFVVILTRQIYNKKSLDNIAKVAGSSTQEKPTRQLHKKYIVELEVKSEHAYKFFNIVPSEYDKQHYEIEISDFEHLKDQGYTLEEEQTKDNINVKISVPKLEDKQTVITLNIHIYIKNDFIFVKTASSI